MNNPSSVESVKRVPENAAIILEDISEDEVEKSAVGGERCAMVASVICGASSTPKIAEPVEKSPEVKLLSYVGASYCFIVVI